MKRFLAILLILSSPALATDLFGPRNRSSGGKQCTMVNVSGTETNALCVDPSSGASRVGIGTTAPDRPLEVWGQPGITNFTGLSASRGAVAVKGGGANGDWEFIDFSGTPLAATSAAVRIGAQVNANGSIMAFGTSNSYVSGITNQAITIDRAGNVGINSSTPASQLDVQGASAFHGDATFTGATAYQKVTNTNVAAVNTGTTLQGAQVALNNTQYFDVTWNTDGPMMIAVGDGGGNGAVIGCWYTGTTCSKVYGATAFSPVTASSVNAIYKPVLVGSSPVVRFKNCTGVAGFIAMQSLTGKLVSVSAIGTDVCP